MTNTRADRELKVVGTRPIRPDGVDKVTGRANAITDATGRRLRDLPMSPPKVLAEFDRAEREAQRLAAE